MTIAEISAGKLGQPMTSDARVRIEAHLADHLASPLSLRQLAAVAGMYVPDFMDAFRAEFGIDLRQYRLARRLERARVLLVSSEMPIKAIVRATGFHSDSHLSAMFKDRFGMPPGAYRRQHQPAAADEQTPASTI